MRDITTLLVLLLGGCSASHGVADDTAQPDAFVARADAFVPRVDAFVPRADAFVPLDACVVPLGEAGWVSADVGACLGFAEASCATCHVSGEGFDMRPRGVGPPPMTGPSLPRDCGLCRP